MAVPAAGAVMVEGTPPGRATTRRAKRATGSAKPKTASVSGGTRGAEVAKPVRKQAVVVIHGIGEQRPLATLREFVETVYRRDPVFAGGPDDNRREAADGLNPVSIVP